MYDDLKVRFVDEDVMRFLVYDDDLTSIPYLKRNSKILSLFLENILCTSLLFLFSKIKGREYFEILIGVIDFEILKDSDRLI
ncbi:MAG: hypothetical protein U9N42_08505 [Campylobacterota bacterium]|nr:hypothetical protein [Campylobacterota bacterium]